MREQVRERYAAAVQVTTTDPGAGCCAPSETFDGGSELFGAARYALGDREQLPGTAKLASLGCGNPTAVAELHEGETVLDLGSGGGINVLLSARNTWAAYDVSLISGRVLWRLGGKHSTFKMGPGTGTAWQHDVRWQPDHTITAFDDGSVPKVHSQSRAIRERIDWAHRSVSLVARYVHTPALSAGSQGNCQILPNGDAFVGWGAPTVLHRVHPHRPSPLRRPSTRPGPVLPGLPLPMAADADDAAGDRGAPRRVRRRDRLRQLERRHRRLAMTHPRRSERHDPHAGRQCA